MSKISLPPEQAERLAKLAALPDDTIDTSDIPEAPPENAAFARRPGLANRACIPTP